jgi:uncharacterized protein (UPF0261 family)
MLRLPIAISTGPQTRTLTAMAERLLSERRRLVRTFEADGVGGRQLEAEVLAGRIATVLDLTLTELAAELLGLPGGAGPDRLTAAALRGVPQVIGLGGLDAVGDHRLTDQQCDRLGHEIAQKASAAGGPVTLLLPKWGVSQVLVQSLHNWRSPQVGVREFDCHANDPLFAIAAVDALELDRQ